MITQKTCRQCGHNFIGRSNQLYCNSACKQQAFQQGKTNLREELPTTNESKQSVTYIKSPSIRSTSVSKTEIELQKIRLQGDEAMRRLDYEDRERERQHELEKQDRLHHQQLELIEQQRKANYQALQDEIKANEIESTTKLKPEPEEDSTESADEQSSGIGWGLIATGFIGVLVYKFLNGNSEVKLSDPQIQTPKKYKPGTGLDGLLLG